MTYRHPNPSTLSRIGFLGLAVALTLAGGCSLKGPKRTQLMKKFDTLEVSSNELRVFIRDTSDRFAGVIEVSADEIIATTDDPRIRYNALVWKSRAIPVAFGALFQPDPLVAVLDSWAFTEQMRQYFTTGEGQDLFGDLQPIAIRAMDLLEKEVRRVARAAAPQGDMEKVRELMQAWAKEFPLHGPTYTRPTLSSHLADLTETKKMGAFKVVGSLSTSLADLTAIITSIAELIPKQARWQAEILFEEKQFDELIETSLADLGTVADSLHVIREVVDDIDTIIPREREAVIDAVRGERLETLDFMEAFVAAERSAVFAEIAKERAVVLEAIRAERLETIEVLQQERAVILNEAEALSERLLDKTEVRIESSIDYLFYRLVQLLAVAGVLGFVAAWVLIRTTRARQA